jgi:hypothetical protein
VLSLASAAAEAARCSSGGTGELREKEPEQEGSSSTEELCSSLVSLRTIRTCSACVRARGARPTSGDCTDWPSSRDPILRWYEQIRPIARCSAAY